MMKNTLKISKFALLNNNNSNYYNFLHACANNSSKIQWLWSAPDDLIAKKLSKKFPTVNPKILQTFCKNLSLIKKEKKKISKNKDIEITPLAIVYFLKNNKQISKHLSSHHIGECRTEDNKAIKIYINYQYKKYLKSTIIHELTHAKIYLSQKGFPILDSIVDKPSIINYRNNSKTILNRLDEIFRDEYLAYNSYDADFQIITNHQVGIFVFEKFLNAIFRKINHLRKIKHKKTLFKKYYNIYLQLIKQQPLYLYLGYYNMQRLKKKYPRNYHQHFFNLFIDINCRDFIAAINKKLIQKYKKEQKYFIAQFINKANTNFKNDPNDLKRKKTYEKLLTPKYIFKLHLFNSYKLLKTLLLILSTYTVSEQEISENVLDHIFDLIMQAYLYCPEKIRHQYRPLIIELLEIKKRYLPKNSLYGLSYLEHTLNLMKNSYL
ncbi:MAG: hypothetical protein V1898_05260 [Patescibacteria group bacterium]